MADLKISEMDEADTLVGDELIPAVQGGANVRLDPDMLLAFIRASAAYLADLAEAQPLDSDLTTWSAVVRAAGFDALVATPTVANLNAFLTNGPVKAAGRETIYIPARGMDPRTTNGAAAGTAEMTTNKNMFSTLDFDAATQEFAQFEIHMPKSWNLGTITFEPNWSHPSTTTNFGVVWALQAVALSNDDAGDVAFGTEQTSTDTGGTTNDRYIGPESAAITVGGTPAAGDIVQFQIKRNVADGSDNMAVDARLHGIRVFFTTNASTDV